MSHEAGAGGGIFLLAPCEMHLSGAGDDSEYAAKSVLGIFKGLKNQALISEIRKILFVVQKKRRVHFSKVKDLKLQHWLQKYFKRKKNGKL